MANLIFNSRAAFLLAALACACGGSSQSDGAGGASSAGAPAEGGASANGASGSPATSNPNGSSGSGSGSSGAGNAPGTTNNGTCPALTPCGGDLVGEWTIKEMCFDFAAPPGLVALCPDVTFTVSPVMATGVISFKADNTMTSSASITIEELIHFPGSCLTEAQCTSYGSQLSAAPGVTDGQCSYDANTGCSCSLTSSQPSMSSGTYQVQGNNVTVTNATSGATEVDSFCVSDNTLRVRGPSNNGNAANLVLTR